MITPLIIYFAIWIDNEKIKNPNNKAYKEKYGSLFEEFKTKENMAKYLYYSVLTFRGLVYGLSQIYLNSYEYWQKSFNLGASFFVLLYLLKFQCFKEKASLVSNIISEIFNCFLFLIVFCKSLVGIFQDGETFDFCFICSVICQVTIQYCVNLYVLFIEIRKYYRNFKCKENLQLEDE